MNRSLPSMLTLIPLALILLLYMFFFRVRESQVAVVRTFGQIAQPDPETGKSGGVLTEAGPYFRWPWPIQSVTIYDDRLQMSKTPAEETTTRDGKTIIVSTSIGWRIADPYLFTIRCSDVKDAETKLLSLVRNDRKAIIGAYAFANMVSISPEDLKYDEIESRIARAVTDNARKLLGINVRYAKMDKLALPKQITESVFTAMKSERQAEAARYTSEGESRAKQIKGEAESIAETILSFANVSARRIEAEGIRRAAEYNSTFRKDESLAVFLLLVENLPNILKDRTTLVFDQRSPLVNLLTGAAATAPAGHGGSGEAAQVTPLDLIK